MAKYVHWWSGCLAELCIIKITKTKWISDNENNRKAAWRWISKVLLWYVLLPKQKCSLGLRRTWLAISINYSTIKPIDCFHNWLCCRKNQNLRLCCATGKSISWIDNLARNKFDYRQQHRIYQSLLSARLRAIILQLKYYQPFLPDSCKETLCSGSFLSRVFCRTWKTAWILKNYFLEVSHRGKVQFRNEMRPLIPRILSIIINRFNYKKNGAVNS